MWLACVGSVAPRAGGRDEGRPTEILGGARQQEDARAAGAAENPCRRGGDKRKKRKEWVDWINKMGKNCRLGSYGWAFLVKFFYNKCLSRAIWVM
ncbi:hypothetical protein BRADI_4g16238v3 [Brachypodium distachyon]|uniref:Uncharacterized protein n=1 Tax=Brachypodium distachyon TaxID=15368 RepID=A0A2K2CN43_BRADI|nr:hypothetical protein BRADI_4g16238v3 [Brachypodium distachyon]